MMEKYYTQKNTISLYYNKKTKTLLFPNYFNEELKDLPIGVEIIIFDDYGRFDHPVDNLPLTLKVIKFGSLFNHPVDNLPPNLTSITFGYYFNQPVDNLPPNLTHLSFGFETNFNHPLDNLPKNIKELVFPCDSFIKNIIPEHIFNIKILFHHEKKHNEIIDNLPVHIKQIKINNKSKIHFLKKIPFGCKIIDQDDKEISCDKNKKVKLCFFI